jgi:hypothetical protein
MSCRALFKGLLAAKGLVAIIELVNWSVGWRNEVLIKGLLAAKRPVTLVSWSVSWRTEMLVEGLLAAK